MQATTPDQVLDQTLDNLIAPFEKGTPERDALLTLNGLLVRFVAVGTKRRPPVLEQIQNLIASQKSNAPLLAAMQGTFAAVNAWLAAGGGK